MIFSDFIKNFRETLAAANKAQSSTDIPSGETRTLERIPTLVDENGHQKVWGFEQDKSRYKDVTDASDPELMNSFTWRDYTVTPKNDERKSVNFSIAYDGNGNIAGVMKKDEGFDDGRYGMVYPTVFGRDNLKKFFSQFDRDATSYRVWQNESYDNGDGTGDGQASIIFDSDEDDAPFVPSTIFKNIGLAPLPRNRQNTPSPNGSSPLEDAPIYFTNTPNFYKSYRKINKA